MKPSWDKLMKQYEGHENILVADVDCTAGGKDLCEQVGVEGFPTIKHGDPNDLEDYDGGRDFSDLETFAKENLKPKCGPTALDLCDAEKKKQIEGFMNMPAKDLLAQIEAKEKEIKTAETEFETFLKGLQEQYEEGQKNLEAKKNEIKESGLGLMKSVKASLKTSKEEL
uniref:Thioredoxin domain-containing protein n=1 Tax=Zooxanthella nutricula TaxID=1333877 RepID=A0A6U6RG05_9DINO|mmetsp:Transcript_70274/g.215288  ORF Transcript_70274/g.215288 Transcript_70274/m.215288 type:complete len:169 (+) Transcript_70274:217-723(+)